MSVFVCLCLFLGLTVYGCVTLSLDYVVKIQWYARSGWRSGFFENDGTRFCGVEDADTEFETFNYGGLHTTLRQEWEYVVTFLCNPVIVFFVDTRSSPLELIFCLGFFVLDSKITGSDQVGLEPIILESGKKIPDYFLRPTWLRLNYDKPFPEFYMASPRICMPSCFATAYSQPRTTFPIVLYIILEFLCI